MTFEELDARYPNGFVDAEIINLAIDYEHDSATMLLNLRGNLPDDPNSDEYARASLTLRGVFYFAIEPPDVDHLFRTGRRVIQFDAHPEDPGRFPLFERLEQSLWAGSFSCRFFVHDWNSFIHIAARDAEFSWVSGS